MIGILRRAGRPLLAFLLLLSLASCAAPPKGEGTLTVLPPTAVAYREETLAAAAETVRSLLASARASGDVLPPGAERELWRMAEEIVAITASLGLSERTYLSLHTLLADAAPPAMEELSRGEPGEATRALYLAASDEIGADTLAHLLYRLILYRTDYLRERAERRYEEYGYPHLLLEAERRAREGRILRDDIGETAFSEALRLSMIAAELAKGEGSPVSEGITPAELLAFLRCVPRPHLSPDGWELLLSYLAPEEGDGLLTALSECGDLPLAATVIDRGLPLLLPLLDRLTEADAAALTGDDGDAAAAALLRHLTDAEWEALDALLSLPLAGDYEARAQRLFGQDYLAFLEGLAPAALSELRTAAREGGDTLATLISYLAGKSPALTYELLKGGADR